MDRRSNAVSFLVLTLALALLVPAAGALAARPDNPDGGHGKPTPTPTSTPTPTEQPPEAAGNSLSYPVIWAEGVTKVLPGTAGMTPVLDGEWWYQWGTNGTDPDVTPASCAPDPDDNTYCDDGLPGTVGPLPGIDGADKPLPLAKAYLQKDVNNTWQAESADWSAAPVNVNWIDWGDNLESLAWTTKSQVRTEVVLIQDLVAPMLEYQMRHTSGWGIDEVHGLAATLADEPLLGGGTQATVYSHCARLTIQLLLVDRDDPDLGYLVWDPGNGWTEPEFYPDGTSEFDLDLVNPHIFNGSVHEGGDGPGYYSAEINVKGKIIYGYTWNVRSLNDKTLAVSGAGDYRLTFSFDETCGTASLNTFFVEGTTEIVLPLETEEITVEAEPVSTGGVAVLDFADNLTYIDISIEEKSGGGKK